MTPLLLCVRGAEAACGVAVANGAKSGELQIPRPARRGTDSVLTLLYTAHHSPLLHGAGGPGDDTSVLVIFA